jgi:hypothetical protein
LKNVRTDTESSSADAMPRDIELLADVAAALAQIEAGAGVSNQEAKAELRKRFAR